MTDQRALHNLSLTLLDIVNEDVGIASVVASTLSLTSALFVILSLAIVPRLRAHPVQLFLNRVFLDSLIGVCLIATFAASFHVERYARPDSNYIHQRCRVIGFFYQVAVFGSSCWHLAISLDLLFTIRNPFRSAEGFVKHYYLLIYTAAVTSAIVMLARGDYGYSRYNTCERRDDVDNEPANIWLARLLYGQYKIYSIFSLPIVMFSARVLRRTLPPSDKTRQRTLKLNFGCAFAFSIEFLVRFSVVIPGLILWHNAIDKLKREGEVTNVDTSSLSAIAFCYVTLEGLRGFLDSAVWFGTTGLSITEVRWHFRRLWAARQMQEWPKDSFFDTLLPRSICAVLRHDMIRCTSWGIIDSAPVGHRKTTKTEMITDENGGIQLVTISRGLAVTRRGAFLSGLARKERTQRKIHCPGALHCKVFSFCDYSPDVFNGLRTLRGISAITYCKSFGISPESDTNALSEKFTEGRSGSFFYFTQDNKYIVKTVTSSEANFLQSNIGDYYSYLHRNPNSLLTRFLGLHATRLSAEQKYITIAVMENIFPTDKNVTLCERYDLKGSWVDRQTLKGKDRHKPRHMVILKDSDLERKFYIGHEQKEKLLQQLQRDVQFLLRHGIMDYSLLVGVRKVDMNELRAQNEKAVNESNGFEQERMHQSLPSLYQPPGLLCPLLQATDNVASRTASRSCFQSFQGGVLSMPFPEDDRTTTFDEQPSQGDASSRSKPDELEAVYACPQRSSRYVYYIGLIDILQQYTFGKRLENFYKTNVRCVDREGVSAVDVELYADRFLRAMKNYFA